MVFQNIYVLKTFNTFKDDFYGETMETVKRLISKGFPCSPAVKGQNCSFFDKSIKLGRVASLHKTNIS